MSSSEQLGFFSRVAFQTVVRRRRWALYNHVGIARAHLKLPGPLRTPYCVFLHGIEIGEPEHNVERQAEYNAARYEVIRRAAVRISNSHYTALRIERSEPDLGPVTPCPLALLPASTPTGTVDNAVLSRVGSVSAIIVGRMSAVERYKGHDALLEAWPEVISRVPAAQLVIVGRGDDVDRLRGKAAALGVSQAVLFCGFVSDATLSALLERVALFAMPSRGEGFGLAYLEAMRAGLPCIGSNADAAVDVIVDGATGYLIDPASNASLASRIAQVLADPSLARGLGAAGRRRLDSEFTFDQFRLRLGSAIASLTTQLA